MNDEKSNSAGRHLELATDALRDLPIPPGPDAVFVRQAADLLQVDSTLHSLNGFSQRRRTVVRLIGLAASALVFAGVIGWLVPVGSSPGGAVFAEMLKRVTEVRTAVFKARADWTDANPPLTIESTYYVLQPNRMRVDQGEDDVRYVLIIDLQQKQMLGLYPTKMTATRSDFEFPNENKITNVMQHFRRLSSESVEFLGRENLDGRDTLQYHGKIPTGYYWLWIAADDHLPVKMVTSVKPDKTYLVETFSDFRWNVPLDEDSFSLEIPEGYTDVTQPAAEEALTETP